MWTLSIEFAQLERKIKETSSFVQALMIKISFLFTKSSSDREFPVVRFPVEKSSKALFE